MSETTAGYILSGNGGTTIISYGANALVIGDGVNEAYELRRKIYNVLENGTVTEFSLSQTWTRLAVLLHKFKAAENWRELCYTTFDEFMLELADRYKRRRTSLYGYLSVAEHLLPTISEEKLEQMGISKALEVNRAMKQLNGKPLPDGIIEAALDEKKTVKELRGDIGKALNTTEESGGSWFDLSGFFITPEEKAEFKEAFQATELLLDIKPNVPDHIRRKEVILTWMREWWGTHAAEANGADCESSIATFIRPGVRLPDPDIDDGC